MNHFAIMAIEKQQQQAKVSNHYWTENPCELCSTNFHIIVLCIINSKKSMYEWFDSQKQSKEQHLWLMGLHEHENSENIENNFYLFDHSMN